MPDKQPDKSRSPLSGLKQDVKNYIRRRDDNLTGAKETNDAGRGGRKHTEIQLLVSELENLLLTIAATDSKVYEAREKVAELKKLLNRELGIK